MAAKAVCHVVKRNSQVCSALQLRSCSNMRNIDMKRYPRRRKQGGKPTLSSVLPQCNQHLPTFDNIDKQLATLDSMISNLNIKIAEQREQLTVEEQAMESEFGVKLPAKYRSLVGSVDVDCPPSRHTCIGCGAPIHCCSPHQPGFISSAKFHALNDIQMQNCTCLRCKGLAHHDVLLDVKVSSDEYRDIISSIREERSVILHIVDVTDYQNSTIPDLLDMVGYHHPVYVIANKVDLLPKDHHSYLRHIEKCITAYAKKCYGRNVKHVTLVSALTGYGVEQLVSQLLGHASKYTSHFHLIGCTNSGKSTLFNSLLMSDLCKALARDKIGRATTSIWPGTTLNILKFPVQRLPRYMMAQRTNRIHRASHLQDSAIKERNIQNATLKGSVEVTPEPVEELTEEDLERVTDTEYKVNDVDSHYSLSSMYNNVCEPGHKRVPSFDYREYADSRWMHDTPGLINPQQIINNLDMTELRGLLMRQMALPRTFSLRRGMTLFIGGIGRLDVIETGGGDYTVHLTVIAANSLPIVVVDTEKAEEYYQIALQEDQLKIPSVESDMERFPKLEGHHFVVQGVGYKESLYDIQLSSLGWAGVTYCDKQYVTLKAYTPGGAGCHLRPSLLPYAVRRKGKRIRGSRTFSLREPLLTQ